MSERALEARHRWRRLAGAVADHAHERLAPVWTRTGLLTSLELSCTGVVPFHEGMDPEKALVKVYRAMWPKAPVEVRTLTPDRGRWRRSLLRNATGRARDSEEYPVPGHAGIMAEVAVILSDVADEVEAELGEVRRSFTATGRVGDCCAYDFAWVDHLLLTDRWAAVIHMGELD